MSFESGLILLAVLLPAVGALVLWRWRAVNSTAKRALSASISGLNAAIALTFFLQDQLYACIFQTGPDNCVTDGLAVLSLLVLSNGLVLRETLREENSTLDYILMLTLNSIWAGLTLPKNFFFTLIFLNLFLFWIDRYLKSQGTSWRFLVLRDEYKDDYGPQ
jgi:hypothetical protein